MMTFYGNTTPKKAGKLRVASRLRWDCDCRRFNPPYLIRCPDCGKSRDETHWKAVVTG